MKRGHSRRGLIDLLGSSVLRIDRDHPLGLQDQIRRKIVAGIALGSLSPGTRMPSSRALAAHLGVCRNTVAAAYQKLIADGHLEARPRSGIFVGRAGFFGRGGDGLGVSGHSAAAGDEAWDRRLAGLAPTGPQPAAPPQWQKYPYPFVEGRLDRSLFPVHEWREASRLTLSVPEVQQWAADRAGADDPMLVQELRTKVLPRRGIHARPDEVLVTSGAQQSLFLVVELLVQPGSVVAVEEPGNPELIALLRRRGARLVHQPVDRDGMVVDDRLAGCAVVFVSPGHQRPTGATLSLARRAQLLRLAAERDFVVVEDDFECETNYLEPALPALRAGEGAERVVYAATLAQALAPALRIGVLAASPAMVRAARDLRRITSRGPPLSVQRTAAHLLALGHYDTIMIRVGAVLRSRLTALRNALNHYLPKSVTIPPVRGGTTYWVRGPEGLEVGSLAAAAEARGVLIEPASPYYAASEAPRNLFRLSVTGIREESIRPGIAVLAEVIRSLQAGPASAGLGADAALGGADLRRTLSGATLLVQTVYGDPCSIDLAADGTMSGRAGFANEDVDTGRWWIEGDFWCRQWREWAYGEAAKFRVVIDGDTIRWLNAEGRQIDSGLIARPPAA